MKDSTIRCTIQCNCWLPSISMIFASSWRIPEKFPGLWRPGESYGDFQEAQSYSQFSSVQSIPTHELSTSRSVLHIIDGTIAPGSLWWRIHPIPILENPDIETLWAGYPGSCYIPEHLLLLYCEAGLPTMQAGIRGQLAYEAGWPTSSVRKKS